MIKIDHNFNNMAVIFEDEINGESLPELVKKQAEIIKRLETRIVELEAVIVRLQKDSHNSSKPPSPDTIKPKTAGAKERKGSKRKIGGTTRS